MNDPPPEPPPDVPRPAEPSHVPPVSQREALRQSRGVIAFTAGGLLFLVAAYLCEAGAGGGIPCAVTEGLGLGGLLSGLAVPLRRRLMRRWPERSWPDPFWFLVWFVGAIVAAMAFLAAIT